MKQKEIKQEKFHLIFEMLVVVGVLLVCELFFFRNVVSVDALIADRYDGRLTMLLTEHWWNFFIGREKFSELAMFYPCEEVLGYTDLLMGYGIIHSFLRLIGFNMYHAYKFTLILVHVLGTTSMYYLMRKKLKCSVVWALFGTIAFCYSNSYAVHIAHTQLNAISFLPLLMILIIGFVENFDSRRKRNIYGYSAVVWFVLLTYNSWYIACFTGFFCFIFLIVYFVKIQGDRLSLRFFWNDKLSHAWKDILGYVIVMAILYIPFIMIYFPVLKNTGGYNYDGITQYMPELIDIINVTPSNFMLGWWMSLMKLLDRGYSEVAIGFSVVLLVVFFVAFLNHNKQCKQIYCKQILPEKRYIEIAINSICVAVIIGIFIPIRISANGVSLWWFVYTFIPAMKSVRVVGRFLLWLSFPMSVVTAFLMNRWLKDNNRKLILSVVMVVMLVLSNINLFAVGSAWNASDEMAFIQNVAEPPADLESFYIMDSSQESAWDSSQESVLLPIGYQLDAFEIANYYEIKTINGYSGNVPSGWSKIWDPKKEQYESGIYNWIKGNELKNVYAYDRNENIWIPYKNRLEESDVLDDVFCPEVGKFSISSGLEDIAKGEFAWTFENFETTIRNSQINDTGLVIRMRTYLSRYLLQNPEIVPEISLYIDGEFIQNVEVTDEMMEIVIPMQSHQDDTYNVSIRTNCYFVPKDIGINEDGRSLSVALYYIGN